MTNLQKCGRVNLSPESPVGISTTGGLKMRKVKFVSVFVLLALVLSVGPGEVVAQEPLPPSNVDQTLQNDIEAVLSDYSRVLSTGQITQEAYYTPMMKDLIQERRSFYEEYFEIALHSTLESITSEFLFDPGSVDADAATPDGQLKLGGDARVSVLSDEQLSLQVTEIVTLHGRYNTSLEEAPTIQAARWALARTDNEAVKQELKEYIQRAAEDIAESSEEGFEITLTPRHSLIVAKSRNGIQIVQDSFTNRSNDDPGTDNVIWTDGEYVRNKPDFTEYPNYRMYTKPVNEMGKEMLDFYTKMYGKRGWGPSQYNRTAAKNYINSYVQPGQSRCNPGFDIYETRTAWSTSYTQYKCVDCTNYVSQALGALGAGGLPPDGTWYKDSFAWINTPGLWNWLWDKHYGWGMSTPHPEEYVSEGDLGFTSSLGHAVMYTSVYPLRYSAHSNDRLNHPWVSTLSTFFVITY